MKQGKLINRIMMLVLLAAVVVYLAASAWRSFRDPYTFVMSYAYTVDDSLEATGFLVREETVLTGGGGTVELLPEEGEKVARGETVALLYQSGEGLERRQELESLTLEREHQKITGASLTLRHLGEAVYSPRLPDKGAWMQYDLSIPPSSYVESDLAQLLRTET